VWLQVSQYDDRVSYWIGCSVMSFGVFFSLCRQATLTWDRVGLTRATRRSTKNVAWWLDVHAARVLVRANASSDRSAPATHVASTAPATCGVTPASRDSRCVSDITTSAVGRLRFITRFAFRH